VHPSPSPKYSGRSGVVRVSSVSEAEALICEFCGLPITAEHQECAALDEGECKP